MKFFSKKYAHTISTAISVKCITFFRNTPFCDLKPREFSLMIYFPLLLKFEKMCGVFKEREK